MCTYMQIHMHWTFSSTHKNMQKQFFGGTFELLLIFGLCGFLTLQIRHVVGFFFSCFLTKRLPLSMFIVADSITAEGRGLCLPMCNG